MQHSSSKAKDIYYNSNFLKSLLIFSIMINLTALPTNPGVYLFKDKEKKIIYVGKAKNIKKRVSSYFKPQDSPKTQLLVKHIDEVECIIVDNEVEALLLENKLIKQHSPKYNINLKDSKTYAYLILSAEPFPRIYTSRKIPKKGKVFGPFVDGSARKELLQLVVQLFKVRVCSTLPKKACLNYHLGLCSAPCINNVNKEQYDNQVQQAIEFLSGNTKNILSQLEAQMKEYYQKEEYEKALAIKKQINAIHHLQEKQKVDLQKRFDQDIIAITINNHKALIELFTISKGVISGKREFSFDAQDTILEDFITLYYSKNPIPSEIIVNTAFWKDQAQHQALELYLSRLKGNIVHLICPQRGEKVKLIRLAEKNAEYNSANPVLNDIKDKFNLPAVPITIECFDISNLGYDYIVGAMTQWVNGKANPMGYRRFEIRTTSSQDDFSAMREVVYRRYKRLQEEQKSFPDLIIIDGGAAHLASALESLQKIGVQIPIIALAKKEEEIYLQGEKVPLHLEQQSPMMLFIRQIRDSVHTFVLSYNRKKRQMRFKEEIGEK